MMRICAPEGCKVRGPEGLRLGGNEREDEIDMIPESEAVRLAAFGIRATRDE